MPRRKPHPDSDDTNVTLLGPEANEFFLLDPQKVLSTRKASSNKEPCASARSFGRERLVWRLVREALRARLPATAGWATYEDGSFLTAQDVADHMNFFIMAAYDTLTSSLTTLVYRLAANPQWQEAVREELRGQGAKPGEQLSYEKLENLQLTEMAFKEAMRMAPPVPSIPRRAARDFEFKSTKIPAQTLVSVNPLYTHYMPEIWPEPERYDPMRFTEGASRERHRYAYIPFSGGAHMCLGLNFAHMQAKCFAWHLLSSVRASIEEGYRPKWSMWPIPFPRDGLRVRLSAVTS